MERTNIEDRDIANPLLAKENLDTNGNSGGSNVAANSGGAATAVVVFSTLIAVCGSYVFGAAVSITIILLLILFNIDYYQQFWAQLDGWRSAIYLGYSHNYFKAQKRF